MSFGGGGNSNFAFGQSANAFGNSGGGFGSTNNNSGGKSYLSFNPLPMQDPS